MRVRTEKGVPARMMVALEVTAGNEDDGKQLISLLDQVEKSGTEIQEVIADTGYSRKDNLVELANQNIQARIPLNRIIHTGGVKQEGFQYNKDADAVVCPAGELSDFKERMQKRKIIEHKNAELKRFHGMNRARYYGLLRMRTQAVLTAFVVNAKRMVKLMGQNCSPPPMKWAAVLLFVDFLLVIGFLQGSR